MPALNESNSLGDLLKYEAPNLFSRESITVGAGANLTLGTVLGRVTASGKYVILAPAASDGSQTAAAVLLGDAAAASADAKGLILARHGIVADHALVWPGGITNAQKTAAIGQLEAKGILVRKGV
jgi:Bacteriophage lambda head decoration protein D